MTSSPHVPDSATMLIRPWQVGDPSPDGHAAGTDPAAHGWSVLVLEGGHEVAGLFLVRPRGEASAEIDWRIMPRHEGHGLPARALRLVVDHCFSELKYQRVESTIPITDTTRLRVAARAGLRREGVARGLGPSRPGDVRRADLVVVARLADDPAPDSRDGFIAILNANLPTKRVISQGVLRDEDGRVLLCELTYKREWDLPGGVVDPWESPVTAVQRELREELGVDLPVQGLLAMNWMPPWRGWDDACQFVFDLGRRPASIAERMTLESAEIAAVHWCTLDDALPRIPDYLAVLLRRFLGPGRGPCYLEGGREPLAD